MNYVRRCRICKAKFKIKSINDHYCSIECYQKALDHGARSVLFCNSPG